MPLTPHKPGREFNIYEQPLTTPVEPTWDETFSAAWKLENDVSNTIDMMTRPAFVPQEGFSVGPALRDYDTNNRTSLFQDYGNSFLGVQSEEEMLYTIRRIKEQQAQRDVLERAGPAGFIAAVASGLASPTLFIPFIAGGRGVAAITRGAASGLAATIPAEAALYANQETRTAGEFAFGLAAGTALGGILGGAISVLRKGEREVLEQELIGASRGNMSVGAAEVELPNAGGLAPGAGILSSINDTTRVLTNPVTQTINQTEYESFRVMMQQLSDSGLRMAKNEEGVATSVGGTIENRLHYYTGVLVQGDEAFDDAYARYVFDGDAPSVAPNLRAQLSGQFGQKLSASEFADEVSRAIWNGYVHAVPEVVEAAKATAAKVYEPLLERAKKVGLFPEDVEVVGDAAYVNRVYNNQAIKAYTDEFVSILAQNYEKDLIQRFAEELDKFKGKQARQRELAADLARPESEVAELEAKFRDELKGLEEDLPPEIQMLEEAIATNRATAKALLQDSPNVPSSKEMRKQLLADARDMEKAAGEDYAKIKTRRSDIRRRLRNLTKSVVAVGEKQAKKLEWIDKIEELSLNSLRRLISKAQRTLRGMDKWTDEKLDEEISKLRTQFAQVAKTYDRGEERLVQLAQDEELHKLGVTEDMQLRRAERLDNLAERLENAENLPRAEIRAALEESLTETLMKVQKINTGRAQRAARLREAAQKLDPEVVRGRIREVEEALPRAEGDFARRWEGDNFKATSVNLESGIADFKDIARQNAELVKDKILGTYLRLPYSDLLQERRGAELRRVLHISSKEIDKFLDKDVRRLTRVYTRTLGPDIEFMEKFGTLNGEELLKPSIEEMNAKIRQLASAPKPANMSQKDWDIKQAKKSLKVNADFELHKKNVVAVMERLRGTRGLPSDPDGFAYRAARTIMNLNVLRMMGMVTVSSFPDAARPIMRYGLTRVFRDGFAPLVSNLKAMKLNAAEAKLAGVGTNVSAHMRSMAYRDVTDELYRGSKIEKALEWTSNRMGMVALFDYWTQGGEMLSSSIANAKMMDSLAKLNTGDGNLSEKAATTFLAENGIDGVMAERIWKQIQNGGGGKVDGVWWPNTESWTDDKAMRAYRAALAREALNTIPRPGAERALLSDANMIGRMLYQFKSFGMASMPKILMSGLQQRDMAALSGALASLSLGALSYYTWAIITGGKAREEMLNAGLDKWADEAIARSGIVGNFGEVQRVTQTIPLFAPYTSFSGTHQTRRPGDNLGEALLGPSFDFFQKSTGIVAGLDEPTQGTLGQARRLTPFQNTLILREALDAVEGALAGTLPERRSQ